MVRMTVVLVLLAVSTSSLGADRYSFFRDEGSWERIALYIAVNEYRDKKVKDLRGCVADATAVRDVMESCYDLRRYAFIKNSKATKISIESALLELHTVSRDAQKQLAKTGRKHTVLIYFAGHGDRVEDTNEKNREADFLDETWVPHDGNLRDGKRDIRDDTIHYWMRRIALETNAHVVLISDSCHSGTLYRDVSDVAERSLTRDKGPVRKGGPEPAADAVVLPPGCVAFGACSDRQSALEKVIDGQRRGIFSTALVSELKDARRGTTYAGLFRRVAAKMSHRWPSLLQTPTFLGGELEEAPLLGGVKQPDHAPFESRAAPVRVRRGRVHGVTERSRIAIYANMTDLVNRHTVAPKMRATIQNLGFDAATLKLPQGGTIDADMVALVEQSGYPQFRVRVDGALPPELAKTLHSMHATQQIALVDGETTHELVIVADDKSDVVTFCGPTRARDGRVGSAVGRLRYEKGTAGKQLEQSLLYLARLHNLVTLDQQDDAFECALVPLTAEDKLATPRFKNGILQLEQGTRFQIDIQPKRTVYVAWWWIRAPEQGGIAPSSVTLEFPNPRHGSVFKPVTQEGWAPPGSIGSKDPTGRWWLKVVATDRFLPFWLLDVAPETGFEAVDERLDAAKKAGEQKTRDALGDPFLAAFKDILHGGPKTRSGDSQLPAHRYWATVTIPFDIVAAPAK